MGFACRMYLLEVLTVLLQLQSVLSQSCPSLSSVLTNNTQCQAASDCSGLTCQPMAPFSDYTASFSVTKCVDPVIVDLSVTPSSGEGYMNNFTSSETVHFGGDTSISVNLTRNASVLDFQATIFHSQAETVTLFPESFISLEPALCMCSSLQALASKAENIHPNVESNCVTTRECTAVRCQLTVAVIFTYNVELVILPCDNSVEFLVTDVFGLPVVTEMFVGPVDEMRRVSVLTIDLIVRQIINVFDYSMEVQTFLTENSFGRLEIIPRQLIQLDRTQCDIPEFPTVAMPTRAPPPAPPAADSPYTCFKLHSIAQNIYNSSLIFRCDLMSVCESGLACVLSIASTEYNVDVSLDNSGVELVVTSSDGPTDYNGVKDMKGVTQVALPSPANSLLLLRQRIDRDLGFIGFELDLNVTVLSSSLSSQRTDNLIPYSVILKEAVLPQSCSSLSSVLTNNPQCQAASNCSGLTCQPMAPFSDYTASFSVTKCVDPVIVDLSLTPASLDGKTFRSNSLDSSQVVYFSGQSGINVFMTRNATDLDFRATIFQPDSTPIPLFPESFISLEPALCMCSSLQALASRAELIHPIVESNCTTTRNCRGVRCQLNIAIVFVYFVELVVLPCDNALEFLIEDDALVPVVAERFQGAGTTVRVISVAGFDFKVEQIIEVYDYSMVIQTFLTDEILGRIEIIPRLTIQLDRTQCDIPMFPTVAMPTRAPPPIPLTSNAPSTCVALNTIAQMVYINSPVFRCELKEACESGLTCVLDIAHSQYRVNISLIDNGVEFSVTSLNGEVTYGKVRNRNVSVEIPNPHDSFLSFEQNVDTQKRSVGFMLDLTVEFLTSSGAQQQIDQLIPYTVITKPSPTVSIALPIVIALLCLTAIVATVCVAICIVLYRRRVKVRETPFQRMSDLQEKELENYLNTDVGAPLPGAGANGEEKVDLDSKEETD